MVEGKGGTILVVEDDPGVAALERRRLERAGYAVVTAAAAGEALDHLRQEAVDLILLDYRLPSGVDGLDFYEQVKAAGYDLPVILVTGFSNEATAIQALRAGVRDFVARQRAFARPSAYAELLTPREAVYPVEDPEVVKRLGLSGGVAGGPTGAE